MMWTGKTDDHVESNYMNSYDKASPQVKSLDSKVEEQTHQLDSLNMSIFDIERNTSAQLELEHKDVVSLAVSETLLLELKLRLAKPE